MGVVREPLGRRFPWVGPVMAGFSWHWSGVVPDARPVVNLSRAEGVLMADVWFVLLTCAVFAALGLVVKGAEKL